MSTGPSPRMVIVDDVDPRIQYDGPWFPDKGSQDTLGIFGPPFRNTLHGSQASASLEFAYHGTEVLVFGTKSAIHNVSGVPDLSWKCFLDGTPISVIIPDTSLNNGVFCEQDTVSDGPHILTVNATVMEGQTFWFDEIRYVPSASVPLDQETVLISFGDPQLQYGQGWQNGVTNVTGSIFSFDFIGVSISWYADIYPGDSSSATYSIDGQTPIDFDFGLKNATKAWNQELFETAQLPSGSHTLKVVYQGNNTTPLHLDHLVVQNSTLSSTGTSISTSATSTSTGSDVAGPSTPGRSSTPVGAIVGGVIGGLTLIVFALLGLFLLRRHRRRIAEEKDLSSTPRPFHFGYTTLHPSSSTQNPPLPIQQSTLAIRKPLLAPLPSSPLPLLRRTERDADARAALESQQQGDTVPAMASKQSHLNTRSPDVVVHEDSGVRMPPSTNEITDEVPPLYTVD